ncbi:MAG TPA: proline racemase family protein [Alphaproteobacteria bacterium]|jgi:trans-L-3-hydroxyproline dehydratase|nr:proline racemase family protein [Alphaproteobacteria bacterium]MDP6268970.1 proline racemase family protein [Alphaproteobacteria bacterium]MDP7427228.1 proline racemase family protein [Alphaproteobacteria bacterium]HJM50105.1 proline racemase family protein [Alphaproteobacteria bacterium]
MTEMPHETSAIETVEMHTGGEPVRIVTAGFPAIQGDTILAKRRYVRENLDHLRRLLLFEPRGHYDMYGVIPVEPDLGEADLAVLFMHNEGYSTMCGHAVMALGRWAVDSGLVAAREPETEVAIQCPCGLVRTRVAVDQGQSGAVHFISVPSFAFALDKPVGTETYGPVVVDIAYGGAFYALAPADTFGLDVRRSRVRDLVDAADQVTAAVKAQVPLSHPDDDDLAFLYGTILTDGNDRGDGPSANVCVFAASQVDRSPTGSGVSARVAVQQARRLIEVGEERHFESITGALFSGRLSEATRAGPHAAAIVEVGGQAHYSGSARFTVEADDPLSQGFVLR